MKIFVFVVSILHIAVSTDLSTLSKALIDIIIAMFTQKQIYFDIIIYGNKTPHLMDALDEVMKQIGANFKGKIKFFSSDDFGIDISDSAFILSDSFSKYIILEMNSDISNSYNQDLKFLTYCENASLNYVDSFIKAPVSLFSRMMYYSYYLINTPNSYTLVTREWFSEKICNFEHLKIINVYQKNQRKWSKNLVVKDKFRNFHGCYLRSCTIEYQIFQGKIDNDIPSDPQIELFKGMSIKANFTPKFIKIQATYDQESGDYIYQNGYYFQQCQILFLTAGLIPINIPGILFLEYGLKFFLSPNKPYTVLEKLILPFDETTWIYLIVIFIFAFGCIPFINLISRKMKIIIYGEGVNTPAFNIVAIFFGIGQTKLPDGTAPRIILTSFLWFCLIFRTAYQSLLFEYMANDITPSLPQTIDEMYENNYTIILKEEDYGQYNMFPVERR